MVIVVFDSMLLDHERYFGLGMNALLTCMRVETNVIRVWARMFW